MIALRLHRLWPNRLCANSYFTQYFLCIRLNKITIFYNRTMIDGSSKSIDSKSKTSLNVLKKECAEGSLIFLVCEDWTATKQKVFILNYSVKINSDLLYLTFEGPDGSHIEFDFFSSLTVEVQSVPNGAKASYLSKLAKNYSLGRSFSANLYKKIFPRVEILTKIYRFLADGMDPFGPKWTATVKWMDALLQSICLSKSTWLEKNQTAGQFITSPDVYSHKPVRTG